MNISSQNLTNDFTSIAKNNDIATLKQVSKQKESYSRNITWSIDGDEFGGRALVCNENYTYTGINRDLTFYCFSYGSNDLSFGHRWSYNSNNPLLIAAATGNVALCKLLCNKGAKLAPPDPNFKDPHPLATAVKNDNTKVVKCLINVLYVQGVDVTKQIFAYASEHHKRNILWNRRELLQARYTEPNFDPNTTSDWKAKMSRLMQCFSRHR